MTKTAKLKWVLVGALLVALLALILVRRPQTRGTITDYTQEVAYFLRNGRRRPKFSKCIDNLHRIQISKQMWADNEGKTTNDTPSWHDLRDYLADQWI